ncbi:MAG: ADOP family duplicated permease [Acidobacteriota bacterium]
MWHDFRFALRILGRNRAFTIGVALSLALGIGIATTVFNATRTALLNPLPVPDADQIVTAFGFDQTTGKFLSSSYPDYQDLSRSAKSFQRLSAYVRLPLNIQSPAGTFRLPAEAVSENYFSMLGIRFALGGDFQSGRPDDRSSVILSDRLWTAHFGRSPAVLGQTVRVNGQPFAVVGVAPESYRGVDLSWSEPPQFWIPLGATPAVLPSFKERAVLETRPARFLLLVGRLRPDASQRQAQAELKVLAKSLERAYPASNAGVSAVVLPASQSRFWPGHRQSVTMFLSVLGIGTGLFLLLACANISSLLLGRAVSRTKEMSIRLSLGAARASLVKKLLLESVVLALFGFALALLIAHALNRLTNAFPTALGLPLHLDLSLDLVTMSFCLAISVLAILLAALVPALRMSRVDLISGLKPLGGDASLAVPYRFRAGLVLAQVVLATVLLVGSGILYRALLTACSADLGFAAATILSVEFEAPPELPAAASAEQARKLLEDLQKLPGIRSATLAMNPPLSMMRTMLRVSTGSGAFETSLQAHYNLVGPQFFRTLGIPLMAGRDFRIGDEVAGVRPAVVDQALAGRLWPGEDAIGKPLFLAFGHGERVSSAVIAVARNSRYNSIWDEPDPHIYLMPAPSQSVRGHLILLAHGSPDGYIGMVREAWRSAASEIPLLQITTGDEMKRLALTPYRVTTALLGILAASSVLLSFVGLYSVVSMSVFRRSREIAIRMAVGALPRQAAGAVIWKLFSLAIAGMVFGLVAARYAMTWLAAAIDNLTAWDPPLFGAVAAFLAIVLLTAALIPALRAVRTDPARVFRAE